ANPLWNMYPAKDKWVFLCLPNTDANWSRLCQSLDDAGLVGEPRFDSIEKRRRNGKALVTRLDKAIKRRSAAEWMERWTALDIIASPINNLADLAADPQA